MSYVVDITVTYRLTGEPVEVRAAWCAPDGEWRTVLEELPPEIDDDELESLVRFIRNAIEADPF